MQLHDYVDFPHNTSTACGRPGIWSGLIITSWLHDMELNLLLRSTYAVRGTVHKTHFPSCHQWHTQICWSPRRFYLILCAECIGIKSIKISKVGWSHILRNISGWRYKIRNNSIEIDNCSSWTFTSIRCRRMKNNKKRSRKQHVVVWVKYDTQNCMGPTLVPRGWKKALSLICYFVYLKMWYIQCTSYQTQWITIFVVINTLIFDVISFSHWDSALTQAV